MESEIPVDNGVKSDFVGKSKKRSIKSTKSNVNCHNVINENDLTEENDVKKNDSNSEDDEISLINEQVVIHGDEMKSLKRRAVTDIHNNIVEECTNSETQGSLIEKETIISCDSNTNINKENVYIELATDLENNRNEELTNVSKKNTICHHEDILENHVNVKTKENKKNENINTIDLNDTENIDNVKWPWIPLMDPQGKQYFYNAVTSKTYWTIPKEDISECMPSELQNPPSAFNVANAQKIWQEYWNKCQEAQKNNELSRVIPGISRPVLSENEDNVKTNLSQKKSIAASMLVYTEHYRSPSAEQLKRPARQQVRPPKTEAVGYTQGYEEYNIWYGKYLSDRFDNSNGRREDREKAVTRCNPFTDAGWTRCDLEPPADRPVICLYFAKGCCYLGSKCRYYHRLPTVEDDEKLDMLHDIFGRERFAAHRDDMDGVGTFSEDCRTLFIGDLKVNRYYSNPEEKTEQLIRQQFGLWGPIEDIRVIRNKNIAFIRYKYRVHAEFAKAAMAEQRLLLDKADDQICVRWAHSSKDASEKDNEKNSKDWEMANNAVMKKLKELGYTQEDIESIIKREIEKSNNVTSSTNSDQDSQHTAKPVTVSNSNKNESDSKLNTHLPNHSNYKPPVNTSPVFKTSESVVEEENQNEDKEPTTFEEYEQAINKKEMERMEKAMSRIHQFNDMRSFKVEL